MNPLKFLPVAQALAALSKDGSTKVAALAIDDDGNLLASGFNGFPRGVDDDPARYEMRAMKLKLIAHAEANAIAQAARTGARLYGSTLLVTALHPCSDCAKLIIQAGIRRVLAPAQTPGANPHWESERQWAELMFREAGVELVTY